MKVLLTGAHGQLAHELQRLVDPRKFTLIALSKKQLDISSQPRVLQTMQEIQPQILINAAAYTQVDRAEEDSVNAYAINRDGARHLAIACETLRIPLLHFSTDYVFNGDKNTPYTEMDNTAPLNIYGQSKWEGEQAIREHCSRHIILRVSAVFGTMGVNFVKTMLRLSREKEILRVVSDQTLCPTPAAAIAASVWQLSEAVKNIPAWGTYHYCGQDPVSWHAFAEHIIAGSHHADKVTQQILAISTDKYPAQARRPLYSVLDCSLLKRIFGIEPANWQKGLQDVLRELSTPQDAGKE